MGEGSWKGDMHMGTVTCEIDRDRCRCIEGDHSGLAEGEENRCTESAEGEPNNDSSRCNRPDLCGDGSEWSLREGELEI